MVYFTNILSVHPFFRVTPGIHRGEARKEAEEPPRSSGGQKGNTVIWRVTVAARFYSSCVGFRRAGGVSHSTRQVFLHLVVVVYWGCIYSHKRSGMDGLSPVYILASRSYTFARCNGFSLLSVCFTYY